MEFRSVTYEFVIPSQIHIADSSDWPILSVMRDDLSMVLHKPVTGTNLVRVEGTMGNEGVDVGFSICRVGVTVPEGAANPEWYIPLKPVKECLQWIRVIGSQFWLGTLPNMSRVVARGSIIEGAGKYTNFGGYKTPFPVMPLTKEQWQLVGVQLAAGREPSVPELLVGNAMVSFVQEDYFQAVIQFGVICELELNAFIEDLLTLHTQAVKELYDERKPFEKKLKEIPAILGADKYQDHNPTRANQLCVLYGLRGRAIHRAKCDINGKEVGFEEMASFYFATMDFLHWTKTQRARLGIG